MQKIFLLQFVLMSFSKYFYCFIDITALYCIINEMADLFSIVIIWSRRGDENVVFDEVTDPRLRTLFLWIWPLNLKKSPIFPGRTAAAIRLQQKSRETLKIPIHKYCFFARNSWKFFFINHRPPPPQSMCSLLFFFNLLREKFWIFFLSLQYSRVQCTVLVIF